MHLKWGAPSRKTSSARQKVSSSETSVTRARAGREARPATPEAGVLPVLDQQDLSPASSHQTTMDLYGGTSGYSYKEWKGTFYPEDLPDKQMLRFYGERFRSVEINNTFY